MNYLLWVDRVTREVYVVYKKGGPSTEEITKPQKARIQSPEFSSLW